MNQVLQRTKPLRDGDIAEEIVVEIKVFKVLEANKRFTDVAPRAPTRFSKIRTININLWLLPSLEIEADNITIKYC